MFGVFRIHSCGYRGLTKALTQGPIRTPPVSTLPLDSPPHPNFKFHQNIIISIALPPPRSRIAKLR
ncbi:hypothetical protein RSAG8_04284, partial [Rhizoctonia solani AG-8 WAC10335]